MSQFTISTPSLLSGQGIDVASTVQQLATAARAPEQNWQNQQQQIQSAEGVVYQINTDLATLLDSANALQDVGGTLQGVSATSSNSDIVTATATSGASVGTHIVVVNNLASTASYYSAAAGLSTSSTLGTGSFDLTIGGNKQTINLNNQTLGQLATSINGMTVSGKPLGVTASVITDSAGAHLVIVANNSGAAGAFTIDGTNAPGLGLAAGSAGADASATIDGVPVSSSNNTVSGVIPGVTLQLQSKSNGQEVRIQTQADTQSATQAVNSFVSAYNTIIQDLNSQFAVTQGTSGSVSSSPLEGDSTVRAVQQQLLGYMSQTFGGSKADFSTLGSLGISMNDDGTLTVDATQLSDAMNSDYQGVVSFFQGTSGFATGLSSQLTQLTDPTKGAFNLDLKGMQSTYSSLQDNVDNLETYIATQQQLWLQQYTQMNVALLQFPAQQQEMDALFGTGAYSNSSK
jgi:flagellar hook-associated protein 2